MTDAILTLVPGFALVATGALLVRYKSFGGIWRAFKRMRGIF